MIDASDDAPPQMGRRLHRVLVVDDHPDAGEMLCMFLSALGHDCRFELTGEAGIAAAPDYEPDIVMLDIGLPGMNGYEVARRLRELLGPAVLLVAVTGWGTPADRQNAFAAGFDHHVLKPATAADVGVVLAMAETAHDPLVTPARDPGSRPRA